MKTNRIRHFILSCFTYTRAEKHAALFLTGLLLLLQSALWIRYWLSPPVLTTSLPPPFESPGQQKVAQVHSSQKSQSVKEVEAFFPFDPDTAGEATLVLMGLSPKQAASMIRFREKAGGFHSQDDLAAVRVLRPELLEKWKPWLRFSETPHPKTTVDAPAFKQSVEKARKIMLVEINRADTSQLMDLPFIGAGRARAIVNYRNKLGGYVRKEQLLEIKIIPDSVYEIIAPRVSCDGLVFRQLDINHAPVDSLRHPYLPKPMARIIVSYREQHGAYKSQTDLEKLPLGEAEILTKLAPYLKFNP
ncbi:MAG: helix-hairpin-helix domain-containing protein [Bacteroidia bacterium]